MKKKTKKKLVLTEQRDFINQSLQSRSLVLVGMMGCGKSTFGREIAQALKKPFYDSDREIEKKSGLPISAIFEQYGESYFRNLEKGIFNELLAKESAVIASGGGAFSQKEIHDQILDNHLAIWLNADLELLFTRVSLRKNRPLLQKENPKQILKDLLKIRRPFYKKAPIHIKNDTIHRHKIAKFLLFKLNQYLKQERVSQKTDP